MNSGSIDDVSTATVKETYQYRSYLGFSAELARTCVTF